MVRKIFLCGFTIQYLFFYTLRHLSSNKKLVKYYINGVDLNLQGFKYLKLIIPII
jgi:hypothetical protein